MGAPIIGLIDSGGARIQEGRCQSGRICLYFNRNVKASGSSLRYQLLWALRPVEQFILLQYRFCFHTNKTSYMFVTGPNVVKESSMKTCH